MLCDPKHCGGHVTKGCCGLGVTVGDIYLHKMDRAKAGAGVEMPHRTCGSARLAGRVSAFLVGERAVQDHP